MSNFQEGSYYIEFISMGKSVKVSALDPVSKHEVSIVGSTHTTKNELIRVVVQKLEYMLDKKNLRRRR